MMRIRLILMVISLLALPLAMSACGKDNSTMSYDLTENDCPTGKHEFAGADEEEARRKMCDALQDESLNKSCAPALRRQHFEQNCPGLTWRPL